MNEEKMTLLLRMVLIFLVIFCPGSGQDLSAPNNPLRIGSSAPAPSAPLSVPASGQGDAGNDEVTALITNLRGESGQVRSDGTSGSSENVGYSDNTDSAVLLSFDISSIPREASISSVYLEFDDWDIVGNPFSNLGCLEIYPASFNNYRSQSYSRRSTASPYASICNANRLNSRTGSRSLTGAFTASLGEDRFQLRLQFDRRMDSQPTTETRPEEPDTGPQPPDDPLPPPHVNPDLSDLAVVLDKSLLSEIFIPEPEPTIYLRSIGFGSFLQDDFVRNGEGRSSRYILITPGLNLSEIGITPDMIKKVVKTGQVKIAQSDRDGETCTTSDGETGVWRDGSGDDVYYCDTTKPSSGCPRGQIFDPRTEGCCQDSNDNEICDDRENHLVKIGSARLRINYNIPRPVPPAPPKPSAPPEESAPDLGVGYFKPPEASSLIDASSADWGEVPANQVLVTIDNNLGFEEARSVARQLASDMGGVVVGEYQYLNLFQIETGSQSLDELEGDVDYARRYNFAALAFPNQQVYREAPLDNAIYQGESGRNYRLVGVKEAWDVIINSSIGLSEVRVGVTDDGIYKGYGQFNNTDINTSIKLYPGAPPSLLNSPLPEFQIAGSHGTGIMNLLTANPDRGGLVGIAYVPLSSGGKLKTDMTNIYDKNNNSFITISLLGLKAEIENRCTILSCSWGNSDADEQATEMYENFFTKLSEDYPQLLFVCSAGNEGMETNGRRRIPNGIPKSLRQGSLPNIITVGNIFNNGTISPSSNRNKNNNCVTLAAPGEEAVWGVDNNGSIMNYGGGTSMAAPQVTATAAMIRSINPGLTAGEIKNMLIATGLQNIDGIPAPAELGGIVLAVDEAVKKTIIDVFPEASGVQSPGLATVTIRSTRYEGYTVTVDGNIVGTEGRDGDALDGVYSFKVTGNQQHLIRADHPQYWERWQYFYNVGDSYTYDYPS